MKNAQKMLLIMAASTILSLLFREMNISEVNIVTTFILGVLIVARKTEGYVYGIVASVLGVLLFNFFFTEPYYTLLAYRSDYPVTFIIMLVTAITTSTMTVSVKSEFEKSMARENRIKMLYRISKGLLRAKTVDEMVEIAGGNLSGILKRDVVIALGNEGELIENSRVFLSDRNLNLNVFGSPREKSAIVECSSFRRDTGKGTEHFPGNMAYYIPILGKTQSMGTIGVSVLNDSSLSEDSRTLVRAVANQIAIAVEKEKLMEEQQRISLEMERERLRSNLLRSISHDLRTPLAGISGTIATLISNKDSLDEATRDELLKNVQEDTRWLIHTFENILSITRIDEGRMKLNKGIEVVEEIVGESISIKRKNLGSRRLEVNLPDEPIIMEVDGSLVMQVMVNLLDNAIKYTPDGSAIGIKVHRSGSNVVFEVSATGRGFQRRTCRTYSSDSSGPYMQRRNTWRGGESGLGLQYASP